MIGHLVLVLQIRGADRCFEYEYHIVSLSTSFDFPWELGPATGVRLFQEAAELFGQRGAQEEQAQCLLQGQRPLQVASDDVECGCFSWQFLEIDRS